MPQRDARNGGERGVGRQREREKAKERGRRRKERRGMGAGIRVTPPPGWPNWALPADNCCSHCRRQRWMPSATVRKRPSPAQSADWSAEAVNVLCMGPTLWRMQEVGIGMPRVALTEDGKKAARLRNKFAKLGQCPSGSEFHFSQTLAHASDPQCSPFPHTTWKQAPFTRTRYPGAEGLGLGQGWGWARGRALCE